MTESIRTSSASRQILTHCELTTRTPSLFKVSRESWPQIRHTGSGVACRGAIKGDSKSQLSTPGSYGWRSRTYGLRVGTESCALASCRGERGGREREGRGTCEEALNSAVYSRRSFLSKPEASPYFRSVPYARSAIYDGSIGARTTRG